MVWTKRRNPKSKFFTQLLPKLPIIMEMRRFSHVVMIRHLFIFLPFLMGCGFYSFKGSIPPHIQSISIPLFVNETPEFGLTEKVTEEITNVFITENILKVSAEKNSHSVLRGVIKRVTDTPNTFSPTEEVLDYRFTLLIEVEWFDNLEEKSLLKKEYSDWGIYNLTTDMASDGVDNDGDGIVDREDPDELGDSRELALKIAVRKIADKIIDSIVLTW